MDGQVEALIKVCATCRQNDKSAVTHNAQLHPIPLPVAAWVKVGIDIIGLHRDTAGLQSRWWITTANGQKLLLSHTLIQQQLSSF